jgi:hypothetical protein
MKNTGLEGRENLSQIVAFLAKAAPSSQALPFANSLQRIGKHTAFATGECIRFSEWQMHSPFAKANGK